MPQGFEPAGDDEVEPGVDLAYTPPPRKQSVGRRFGPYARWIVAGLVVLAGFVANLLSDATRDDSGVIVDQGAVNVTEARVGDCLDLREEDLDADVVEEFIGVPCSEPHQLEVFALLTVPGGDVYPGDLVLESFSTDGCEAEFATYTGAPYDTEPLLDYNYFTPVEDGWAQGDRIVSCTLATVDGTSLVGSMAGRGMVHYQSLQQGCYDLPAGAEDGLYGMHPRPCEEGHDVEVFATPSMSSAADAPFDDPTLVEFGNESCQTEYERFLGTDATNPDLTWWYYYPSAESWAEGDHSFTCYLERVDLEPLVGSYAGGSA